MELATYFSMPGTCLDFVDDGIGIGGIIQLQVKH